MVSLSDVELLRTQSSLPCAAWLSVTAQLVFYHTAARAQFALLFSVKYNCEKEVVCGRLSVPLCLPAALQAEEVDSTIFLLPTSCCSTLSLVFEDVFARLQDRSVGFLVFKRHAFFSVSTRNSEEGEHGGQVEPALASKKKEAGWKHALDA